MAKPYMPLMMGDWLRGTRGMRAEVRGVYINLLIHQYDHGFIPADMDTLLLIDPEVGKVWVMLSDKFQEVSPGKLQNKKLEEVRAFWSKQRKNGKKGGRPKEEKPKPNPEDNPNHNHHNDLDIEYDIENKLKEALDEIYIDGQRGQWKAIDLDFEIQAFKEKVRGSPGEYGHRDSDSIRLAFQYQLRHAKKKTNEHTSTKRASTEVSTVIKPGKSFGQIR